MSAPTKRYKAIALEGMGRCLISLTRYDEAYKVYNELSLNYGQIKNKAGHPYGIIAVLQLYEIDQHRTTEPNNPKILLDLYEKLCAGVWLLSTSNYDFFTAEIESILDDVCNDGNFPEIKKILFRLTKQAFPYMQTLVLTDTIEKKVIPNIKEKLSLSQGTDKYEPYRLLIPQEEDFCLILMPFCQTFSRVKLFMAAFAGISIP